MIPQIAILVFGVTAMWLVTSKHRRTRWWGCLIGLCGQPFWVWTTIEHGQYAITALTALYAASWVRGVINNRERRAREMPGIAELNRELEERAARREFVRCP